MAILHKLTLILRRIDPDNSIWLEIQKKHVVQKLSEIYENMNENQRIREFVEIDRTFELYKQSDYGRKLYLIKNSIFGVDIQPIACQIARLRFFISLIIEQHQNVDDVNFGIKPLPNLDMQFIAADSLLSLGILQRRVSYQDDMFDSGLRTLETEITTNRERFFHAVNRQEKLTCMRTYEEKRRQVVHELKNKFASTEKYRKELKNLIDWAPFDLSSYADWFDPSYMFGVKYGFDIVIGNPPYIQLQDEAGKLSKKYQNEGYKSFIKSGDIYCLFYERGVQLLRNGGHLCYITSNKWMRANYGSKLRNLFSDIDNLNIKGLVDFGGVRVFRSATVDTNILFLTKESSSHELTVANINSDLQAEEQIRNYIAKYGNCVNYIDRFGNSGPWYIASNAEYDLKDKIENVGTPLKDWNISIYRGILTGCNNAFLIDNETKCRLIAQEKNSQEVIVPLLRGKFIRRYQTKWPREWLINIHNGYGKTPPIEIENYPAIIQHLNNYYPTLEKRQDKGVTPYHLRNCAYYEDFKKEKIIYAEIVNSPRFHLDLDQFFVEASAFIMTGEQLKPIVGILNSKPASYFFKMFYAGGGLGENGFRYKAYTLKNLPIPSSPKIDHIKQLLEEKIYNGNDKKSHLTYELETELDQLVYSVYEFSTKEIKVVEKSISRMNL